MYHRLLRIFIATADPQLAELLQGIEPLEQFSHEFIVRPEWDEHAAADCAVVILDDPHDIGGLIDRGHAVLNQETVLVACFPLASLPALADVYHLLDQVWVRPLQPDHIRASFQKILANIKGRENSALTGKYLDTLIDSLPDLIWFKDARGAHLKVNNSFCRTVNKTKKQIEGRGHYYIWDIEPEEYAQGEYVCLESEEIVLNKKETCLFDETVKCGGELRKFKTYKSPIFDTDGEVIGTVGFAHDVTDLQNLMIELNILIESLPFAVMVTDEARNITSINQKFIDLFSLVREGVIGQSVDAFLDESRAFTKSKRWIIERGDEGTLLLSQEKILKIHDEQLLDIFGVMAGHIYLFFDITLEYHHKNRLLFDANTDYLTKLNNRRRLQDFMRKTPCEPSTALLLADLDNFKEVNDQFGHGEGDKILIAFSNLLQSIFPSENLFRLGGDEFAIIIPRAETSRQVRSYAEQLLNGFNHQVARQFPRTDISVSIGMAMDQDDSGNFGELFKKADMALYESKKCGKSAWSFYAAPSPAAP